MLGGGVVEVVKKGATVEELAEEQGGPVLADIEGGRRLSRHIRGDGC